MVYKSSSLATGTGGGTGGGTVGTILSSGGTITVTNPSGPSTNIDVSNNTVNTLAGYNSSGVFSDVSIGSNLSLVGGTLVATAGGGAVSSVFGRTGAVTAQWNDYNFNLVGGTASASQGGTGLQTLTAHAVLLGEGVSAVSFATTGAAGRLLIDQGGIDPKFQTVTGDASINSAGAVSVLQVHGVAYPATPNTNTVPVVTSSNIVTYEQVPNAALLNSAITIGATTGLAGGGSVTLGSAMTVSMGTSVANSLAGYNSSGVFSNVIVGTNLALSGGTLSATGAVSSVSNADGSLTISPNAGAVVASLNSAHSNNWTNIQTFSTTQVQTPVALVTTASVITTNAALGNYFYTQLVAGTSTITNPTNPRDSQVISYELQQPSSGSSGTVVFGSNFDFGTTGQPSTTSGASKIDIIGVRYSGRNSKWNYLGSQLGF